MRKCKFKQWLMCERTESELQTMYDEIPDGTSYKAKGGTGFDGFKSNNLKFRAECTFFGYFINYGLDIEEYENGGCSFTCAIVEDEHGKLRKVNVDTIEFLPDDYHTDGYSNHKRIFGW